MVMNPGTRKLALVAHVGTSVGWLGAVVTSLVLAVAALISTNRDLVRGIDLTLEALGWYALVPLSLASLLTGLIQSVGTSWGLLRHYWVIAKLVMNLLATAILLLYMQTLTALAQTARTAVPATDLADPSPVAHALGAIVLLLAALALSVYKPRGLTSRGRRAQRAAHGTNHPVDQTVTP